jgi:hypothetical protein
MKLPPFIEGERVRIGRRLVGHRDVTNLLRLRIDAPDVTLEVAGVPDSAVVTNDEVVWTGLVLEIDPGEVTGLRIERREVVPRLADEPHGVGTHEVRIARPRVLPRHGKLLDLDGLVGRGERCSGTEGEYEADRLDHE